MEDFAYILDYLPEGHPSGKKFRRDAIAYGLGDEEFKLLELLPKKNVKINIGDRVYIGKELSKRDQILQVKRRVSYTELTAAAQRELPFVIERIVEYHTERFLAFFNEAQALTTRFHMLELLPGLGKKTMWQIIEERKKCPFSSFRNLEERLNIKNPQKFIAKRIELELSDPDQKYRIFVAK
jgi:putative nucleotide binding protein